jgi:PAS domain S-box-containing protein
MHEIMTKGGARKTIESSTFKVNYMDMECRCFIRKDITQKQKDEGLRRILEDSLDESSRVIWIIATPPSLKTLYVSRSAEKVFGYPCEMYKDNFFLDVCVHPDYRESFRDKWTENSAITGFPNIIRFRIVRPDGEVRWIEHSIIKKTSEYYVFVNRDITKYTKMFKRFKAKLKESKLSVIYIEKIKIARQLKSEEVSIGIKSKYDTNIFTENTFSFNKIIDSDIKISVNHSFLSINLQINTNILIHSYRITNN